MDGGEKQELSARKGQMNGEKRNLSERFTGRKNFLEFHCAVCLKFIGKKACFFIGNQRKFLKKCKKTLAIPVFILYNNIYCDIEC